MTIIGCGEDIRPGEERVSAETLPWCELLQLSGLQTEPGWTEGLQSGPWLSGLQLSLSSSPLCWSLALLTIQIYRLDFYTFYLYYYT